MHRTIHALRSRFLRTASVLTLLCGAGVTAQSQTIEGAGATFPAPIYKQWFAKFQQATKISVNYQAIGSGGGYNALKDNTVAFGASDAPLSKEEEAALPNPVVHIPTVGGAVVMSYKIPGIGEGLRLTSDIISGIYLGKVKFWDDDAIKKVNKSMALPHLAVKPVHRTDGSGTTYIFTHYLAKVSPEWKSGPGAGKSVNWPVSGLNGKGSDGVSTVVQQTDGAIGYVELAFAIEHKLAYASVRNHKGNFVVASADSTAAAINQYVGELRKDIKTPTVDAPGVNSYPICSLTYILIYKKGGHNAAEATKLWNWVMQPAQQAEAKGLYYAPLPSGLTKMNLATLKSIPAA